MCPNHHHWKEVLFAIIRRLCQSNQAGLVSMNTGSTWRASREFAGYATLWGTALRTLKAWLKVVVNTSQCQHSDFKGGTIGQSKGKLNANYLGSVQCAILFRFRGNRFSLHRLWTSTSVAVAIVFAFFGSHCHRNF